MSHLKMKYLGAFIFLVTMLTACSLSTTKPLTSVGAAIQPNDSSVTVFLLERDLPQAMKRLGIVSIVPTTKVAQAIDDQVKQQLKEDCQRLGANGAYRINDGTYGPLIVSYLVFRYEK